MNDPFIYKREPDIIPNTWELDILCEVGPKSLANTHKELKKDPTFSYICKHCGKELRPWKDAQIYVVAYHLEEHYNIPIELTDRKRPSKKLREQIIKLYGKKCFGCGSRDSQLHIDHIIPQCKGGSAAFRNLQPLCEVCGNQKADTTPNEIEIFSTIFFGKYPADGFEGMFW